MAECTTIDAVFKKLVTKQLVNTMPSKLRMDFRKKANNWRGGRETGRRLYASSSPHAGIDRGDEGVGVKASGGRLQAPRVRRGGALKIRACLNRAMTEKKPQLSGGAGLDKGGGPKELVKCYNCSELGHISTRCSGRASYYCRDGKGHLVARDGLVEGTRVTDILLDMGCTETMVREDLVPENKLLPGEAYMCAHRDMVVYPLANITIEVEGSPAETAGKRRRAERK